MFKSHAANANEAQSKKYLAEGWVKRAAELKVRHAAASITTACATAMSINCTVVPYCFVLCFLGTNTTHG